jgi:hypothetical protein
MPLSDITNKTSKKREKLDDFTRGMGKYCLGRMPQPCQLNARKM